MALEAALLSQKTKVSIEIFESPVETQMIYVHLCSWNPEYFVSVEEIWPFNLCVSPHLFQITSQILPHPHPCSPNYKYEILLKKALAEKAGYSLVALYLLFTPFHPIPWP